MLKQSIVIALAFIGLVVGAGFASGQELLQYFVAYGVPGIWGAVGAAVLFGITGFAILQLGSYYRAKEHATVFDAVSHPFVSRAMDAFTTFTLFTIGFVMLAGAGANLNQQFGFPIWVGSLIMLALVIGCGFLDVDRVTRIIGGITPFIIFFIVIAAIYSFTTANLSINTLEPVAKTIDGALPNMVMSSANYVGAAMALAVSMSLVMGGNMFSLRAAGYGGLIGGVSFGALLVIAVLALFSQVEKVKDAPMPMLELVNQIHPVAGFIMSIVIYAMIFNTAIGVYYALAKRVTAKRPQRFIPAISILAIIGFGLSFVGFETLVGTMYPIIGWVGIIMLFILVYAWFSMREDLQREQKLRQKVRRLVRRKWDRNQKFTNEHDRELVAALDESSVDDKELHRGLSQDVVKEIMADDEAEVEPRWDAVAERWKAEEAAEQVSEEEESRS